MAKRMLPVRDLKSALAVATRENHDAVQRMASRLSDFDLLDPSRDHPQTLAALRVLEASARDARFHLMTRLLFASIDRALDKAAEEGATHLALPPKSFEVLSCYLGDSTAGPVSGALE